MTKDTTVTAPSTMKIMVVAPPDGNIFTVGAKRFRYAEVLPTEACLHRVANSSELRFRAVPVVLSILVLLRL